MTSCSAQVKYHYEAPINFDPSTYVCFKPVDTLEIDGRAEELSWQKAAWTADFVDIESRELSAPLRTRVKMLWDADYFYIYAELEEPHVWATLTKRDAVMFRDDDFEVFIDPDGDGHNYYEIEINAFNSLWDLLLLYPYRNDRKANVLNEWNLLNLKTAVHINGSINDASDQDEGWSVEMAIPWTSLKEMAHRIPRSGDQWRVNFSRVDWRMDDADGSYTKAIDPLTDKPYPESNWVWSPQGEIAMHMPEMWGFVEFSKHRVGSKELSVSLSQDEFIKWNLWNLYWQQVAYHKDHKVYTSDLSVFTIPECQCSFNPTIYVTPHYFEIVALSTDRQEIHIINSDGRIYRQKVKS